MNEVLVVALLLAVLAASGVGTVTVLVMMPADYFTTVRAPARHGIVASAGVVLKNFLGAALVVRGLILALPAVPGPGLLTVVAGLLSLEFLAKRRMLLKLFSRPQMLRSINRLRAKYSRPPLVVG